MERNKEDTVFEDVSIACNIHHNIINVDKENMKLKYVNSN